jgi:hypothetical protein
MTSFASGLSLPFEVRHSVSARYRHLNQMVCAIRFLKVIVSG